MIKVLIKHLGCGTFGSIVDCYSPRIFCPFCKDRVVTFSEVKELTPMELYNLLNHNYNKIISTIWKDIHH